MQELVEIYEQREALGEHLRWAALVQPILEEICEKLGFDQAFVAAVDPEPQAIRGLASVGIPAEAFSDFAVRSLGKPGILVMTLAQGKLLIVQDALRDERIADELRPFYVAWGLHAFAVVPLLPVSCVLVVGKAPPLEESVIFDLLPCAGQLIAALTERDQVQGLREVDETNAIEKEWLWWMLNAVHDPLVLTDDLNNAVFMNVHAERLFKVSPEDSAGKRRAIELNNFLLSATLSSYMLTGGGGPGRELSLVDPIEGNELLFEVICHPATNLQTGEQGLVSVLKDVTDLRRAAEQLTRTLGDLQATGSEIQQERDRLTSILSNVADPIVVTDGAGEIILMNEPANALLPPQGESHVSGQQTMSLANEAKLSSFLVQLKLSADRIRTGELQMVHGENGQLLTMSVTATAVRDEFGELSAVVCVLHDLTGIRELEQRRIQQQLFESEKLAAVGRLAATLAHEINNPLEAIKNALYLLESETKSEANGSGTSARFLEIARKETDRVSGIIRQVLGFYRPVAQAEPCEVNRVLREGLELLDRQLRQHQVVVHTSLSKDLPNVAAPADLLKQVVLNLIINAQDAMATGGKLEISTRWSRATDTDFLAGRYVLIQIRDTGQGIEEADVPYIFDPFFSTKGAKGTGLGLWVSQSIVQSQGGQIKVRSERGKGTTFTVALPPAEAA